MAPPEDRPGPSTVQDLFLNGARRERLRVTIRLLDGSEVRGLVKRFDRYALLVDRGDTDVLLFKHAVASIRPRDSAES